MLHLTFCLVKLLYNLSCGTSVPSGGDHLGCVFLTLAINKKIAICILAILFRPFRSNAHKHYYIIWLSNLSILSIQKRVILKSIAENNLARIFNIYWCMYIYTSLIEINCVLIFLTFATKSE